MVHLRLGFFLIASHNQHQFYSYIWSNQSVKFLLLGWMQDASTSGPNNSTGNKIASILRMHSVAIELVREVKYRTVHVLVHVCFISQPRNRGSSYFTHCSIRIFLEEILPSPPHLTFNFVLSLIIWFTVASGCDKFCCFHTLVGGASFTSCLAISNIVTFCYLSEPPIAK